MCGIGSAVNPWRVRFTISGEIEIYPPEPGAAPTGVITFTTEKGTAMGEITVDAGETTLAATVSFFDAEGNPTVPDTEPVWAVADPSVLTVTPAPDGMSATFAVGAPGVSSVTVSTTETHGGVGTPTDLILTGLVTVTAGDTVAGSIDFTVTPPA
jgi:hypothetical protein